jgi:hypothetical protein
LKTGEIQQISENKKRGKHHETEEIQQLSAIQKNHGKYLK